MKRLAIVSVKFNVRLAKRLAYRLLTAETWSLTPPEVLESMHNSIENMDVRIFVTALRDYNVPGLLLLLLGSLRVCESVGIPSRIIARVYWCPTQLDLVSVSEC